MKATLLLWDDPVARAWAPFALTRPVGEILFGTSLLREKIEDAAGSPAAGYLPAPGLAGFEEAGAPPVLAVDSIPSAAPRMVVSTRYVPAPADERLLRPSIGDVPAGGLRLVAPGGVTVGWLLGPSDPLPNEIAWTADGDRGGGPAGGGAPQVRSDVGPSLTLHGVLLETPWDLVAKNAERIAIELGDTLGWRGDSATQVLGKAPGVHVVGDHPITLEPGVTVDPMVVLDARRGPIHLARDVRVESFTHLVGPAFVGPGSVLMGGAFEAISAGPVCKLHGELRDSIVLGFSNKAHDGYIGHSLLGRWVNLGAFTTSSDLKNNYGSIRVGAPEGTTDTGLVKLGVFLGDHVKTGIGTLLGAGTVVGAGTNLFGDGLSAKWIPPFSWGSSASWKPYRLEPFLETAERAMARRHVELTDGQRRFFGAAWTSAHPGSDDSPTEERARRTQ